MRFAVSIVWRTMRKSNYSIFLLQGQALKEQTGKAAVPIGTYI